MSVTILDIINRFSFSGWGIIIASLIIAVFWAVIYWQDATKRSSKLFFIFSLLVFAWGTASVFYNASLGTLSAHTTVAVLYFIAGFVAPILFLAIDAFSNTEIKRSKRVLALIFGPYLAISVGFLYPGLIVGYADIVDGDLAGRITFGKLFPVYMLYSVVLVSTGVWFLIKKYRESAGIFKDQMRDLLIIFVLTALVALFGTLFIPLFVKTQVYFWIGYSGGALLFLVLTGFIIIKYNFLNVKIIATELFISIITMVLIAELFIASSLLDLFIKTIITFLVVFSSSFLVGSVKREIQSKERIANLLHDLDIISKRLIILDKKKSEFLSIASHHLRDPLTAIKGYASMLSEGSFGDLSQPVREAIEKIYESSGRLITMISDFMDISRIESGDMKYVFGDVDMKKLVIDLAGEMKQGAERARLAFSVTIDEGLSGDEQFITVGDAGKLRQVVSNLIDNSIKYTPRGEVSILLSKSPDGKKILYSQSDTGIGMNDITKEKIFRKFSRAEGVNKVYTEGTGLGLYVAKEIVNKHEGKIWAESKGEGHGSSFYVELDAKR